MSMPVERMKAMREAFLREVRWNKGTPVFFIGQLGRWSTSPLPTPHTPNTQMRAGLQGKPSTLMMLPSMVDVLPDG